MINNVIFKSSKMSSYQMSSVSQNRIADCKINRRENTINIIHGSDV